MKKITDRIIELVQNENLDEIYWFSELGYANSKVNDQGFEENDFIYSFYEQGEFLWNKYKVELRELICDIENGVPKPFIEEVLAGDIRQILETITTAIMATFSLVFAIALPLACLLLKFKIKNFCALA